MVPLSLARIEDDFLWTKEYISATQKGVPDTGLRLLNSPLRSVAKISWGGEQNRVCGLGLFSVGG